MYSFLTRQSVRLSFHYALFLSRHSVCPNAISSSPFYFPTRKSIRMSFHHVRIPFQSDRLPVYHTRFFHPSVCPTAIPSRIFPFPSIKLSVCHSITPFSFPIPQSVHMSFHHALFLSDSSVCHSIKPFSFPIRPSVRRLFFYLPFSFPSVRLLFHHAPFFSHPSVSYSIIPVPFKPASLSVCNSIMPLYLSRPLSMSVCHSIRPDFLSRSLVCPSAIQSHPFSFPVHQSIRLLFSFPVR